MKHLFIINPFSGHKKRQKQVVELLKHNPPDSYKIEYTHHAGHAIEIAKEAARKGVAFITAIGGDGTVNEVASGLVGSSSALGIIPTGSGNGFARSLGIPLNLKSAINVLFDEKTKKVDVGVVNDLYFFTTAGVGFDAVISEFFQQNHLRGFLPYFYYGLRTFFKYPYPPYRVIFNNEKFDICPLIITIANGREFGNGAIIAPMARYDDGYLELCILGRLNFIGGLSALAAMFSGRLEKKKFYTHRSGTNFSIASNEEPIHFHTDGEPHQSNGPLHISVMPRALSVLIKEVEL